MNVCRAVVFSVVYKIPVVIGNLYTIEKTAAWQTFSAKHIHAILHLF